MFFYIVLGTWKDNPCRIIANEMGVNLKVTARTAIEKPGEMAAILNNLKMVISFCG